MTTHSETELLVAQSFHRLTSRLQAIGRFHAFAASGLTKMQPEMEFKLAESLAWATAQPGLVKDPEDFQKVCRDLDIGAMAQQNISSFQGTLDDSCLVFLHAELELALLECFKLLRMNQPTRLLPEVPEDRLAQQNSQGRLDKLSRNFDRGHSLPEKVARLFELFEQDPASTGLDFAELGRIDEIRHDAVHRPGNTEIHNFMEILELFRQWGMECWKLVVTQGLGLRLSSSAYEAFVTGGNE